MADPSMVVEVVTPEESLFSAPGQAIVLRSSDGDLTILPGHTPLVTDVVPGLVRIDRDEGEPFRLAVHGGFLHVDSEQAMGLGDGDSAQAADGSDPVTTAETTATRVRLLAGVAERAEDIDVPRAERARDDAEGRVNDLRAAAGRTTESRGVEGVTGDETEATPELTEAEASLRRAEVRLSVARGDEVTT